MVSRTENAYRIFVEGVEQPQSYSIGSVSQLQGVREFSEYMAVQCWIVLLIVGN